MKSYWINCKKGKRSIDRFYVIEDRDYDDLIIIDTKHNKSWRAFLTTLNGFLADLDGYDDIQIKDQTI